MVGSPVSPASLLNSEFTTPRGAANRRYKKLESDRTSWRSHWIELTDYLLPRRGRYLFEKATTKGRKRNTKIVDNTAGQGLRTLAAGMMSGLTSPARPWFRLMATQDELMEQPGVKLWFGQVEQILRRILASSNFYNTISTTYTELGAFGTHAILKRPHPTQMVHYRPYTAGEYVIAENDFNEVDTLGRCFTMKVSQVVERFVINQRGGDEDWNRVSKAVRNLWNQRNYDEDIELVHMIQPRRKEDVDMNSARGSQRPIMDLYFETGADTDVFLQESGFSRKPFYTPRWDVLGGDVYGYSPGMEALGDIKQLQHEQKRKAQAIDKMVNPPLRGDTSLKGKPVSVIPGGITYVDPSAASKGIEPIYSVTPHIAEMVQDIQEVQGRIQRGFYADLFAMMINSDRRQMTATEVAERHEEKLILLGPILQRLNTELLDPLIEDLFDMAMQRGMLPEAPEALHNADVRIKYVSLLAQAQEAVAATAIERTFAFAGSISEVAPDVMDNLDPDEAIRDYSEILGNSPGVLRDASVVTQLREQREEAARQAAAAEQATQQAAALNQAAQGAKALTEADSTDPNALERVLGGGAR